MSIEHRAYKPDNEREMKGNSALRSMVRSRWSIDRLFCLWCDRCLIGVPNHAARLCSDACAERYWEWRSATLVLMVC